MLDQGVVVVGSKRTDLYGVDPNSGQSSWMHIEAAGRQQCSVRRRLPPARCAPTRAPRTPRSRC
jgi:hypothetical protein